MTDTTHIPVIFLAFANDRDDTVGYLRNLPDEARRLRDVLQPAEQAGLCEVVVRSNSTAGDLFKVFQDPRFRNRVAILHYGGHANGYQLLLETAAGQAAAADAGGLAAFLSQQQGLQLVFLNGCSTQQQTRELLDANIPAVISTSRAIDDQVATEFSYQFYQGLAGGATIRTAYNEAAAAVQTAKGGTTRGLYFASQEKPPAEADRWPWDLYLRAGSESADQWNLPDAAGDPLFGLPPLPAHDLPASPYRHLKWFTRQHAELFFGRGHQIRELYDRLTAPRTAPIMLFYGQSGVGKSSLLDAGLMPRLEQDYEVRYLRRTGGGLLETLQQAFSTDGSAAPVDTVWRGTEERLGRPLIVFLDQVEECFTRPLADLPDELDQLLRFVKATFVDSGQRPRGKLVMGFRKEWLAELETQLAGYELPRSKVFLEPLDQRGIVEVVQGPAASARLQQQYGLTVDEGLAVTIADDLLADRDSAIAPTLQILLTKMWTKATEANYEHPHFSQDRYQDLKRDGILLRDFLNQQVAAFRERFPEAVDSGLLLDLVALHTTPLGTADQRSVEQLQTQYAHLGDSLPTLLQQCQDLFLLTVATSNQQASTKATRLAHDTLAPLVREQFDISDKPGQRARRILDNRSVDWENDQTGTPLDEADLAMVEQGVAGTHALTPVEQRLLEASQRERAKRLRAQRGLRIASVVVVLVIIGFGGIAWWQLRQSLAKLGENLVATLMLSVDKDPQESDRIIGELQDYRPHVLPYLKKTSSLPAGASQDERINQGKQRADKAIALFRLGEPAAAVDLLLAHNGNGGDPDVETRVDLEPLTQFAHRCQARGVAQADLSEQLKRLMSQRTARQSNFEEDPATLVCFALILALGEYEVARDLFPDLEGWYRSDSTSAIHSATGWLLRAWGQADRVVAIDRELAADSLEAAFAQRQQWFVLKVPAAESPQPTDDVYLTFVVFPPGEFVMGTSRTENLEQTGIDETPHPVRLTQGFAVCDHEFVDGNVSWYDAVRRCRALTTQLGLPDSDQCYALDPELSASDIVPDSWKFSPSRRGFRLPREAEWEYACRAGTITRFSFGSDDQLLEKYAVYGGTNGATAEDVERRPNLRGLFNVHGKLSEWCQDGYDDFVASNVALVDPQGPTEADYSRIVRGGNRAAGDGRYLRSAARDSLEPESSSMDLGFRLCVTKPALAAE